MNAETQFSVTAGLHGKLGHFPPYKTSRVTRLHWRGSAYSCNRRVQVPPCKVRRVRAIPSVAYGKEKMKLKILLVIGLIPLMKITSFADIVSQYNYGSTTRRGIPVPRPDYSGNTMVMMTLQNQIYNQEQNELNARANANAKLRAELYVIYSQDAWRIVDGVTNSTRTLGWTEFQGTPREYCKEGVILNGKYGNVLSIRPEGPDDKGNYDLGDNLFLIKNFPYPFDGNGDGYAFMLARYDGEFAYTNSHQVIKMAQFDYEIPCHKIWSAEEIAAFKKQADDKKQEIEDKVLKSNQDAADRRDAYGLLRMGERYKTGEGVSMDLIKAKAYLKKAADAGSTTASKELEELNQN